MPQDSRLNLTVLGPLAGAFLAAQCALVACSSGPGEQGRIRVTPTQVIGLYELELDRGVERLEIKADGSYFQDTVSDSRPIHHSGRWKIVSHFLDGSEVLLLNAVVTSPMTPDDKSPRAGFADVSLYAHNRSGQIVLARNEVADWYYERPK